MLPGFRFRKGISLFPGVRLNISKSGISTSIGKKGATVNLSPHGTTGSVGAPGTGLSYRKKLSKDGKGYYAFLAIMLGFYVLYLFYTGGINKYLPQQSVTTVPEQLRDAPAPDKKPPVKHHRKKHKTETM